MKRMADKGTVVVGCDRNSGQDATFQNTVCEKLESAGYTVEKLPIAPKKPFLSSLLYFVSIMTSSLISSF